jgi:hypothetical protein
MVWMGDHLDRREVLKLLSVTSAPFLIPSPLLAASREIHAGLPAAPSLKALNPHQDATVTTMADLILPATETPGAKEVRVNEFIDHIIADWFLDEERARFLGGLADVDLLTQSLFQKNFVDASAAQQAQILRSLGDDMAAEANAALCLSRTPIFTLCFGNSSSSGISRLKLASHNSCTKKLFPAGSTVAFPRGLRRPRKACDHAPDTNQV